MNLPLLAALVMQFSVAVKTPDGQTTQYAIGEQIVLPTDKYTCHVEMDQDPEHSLVQVVCEEHNKEVLNIASVCYKNKQDKNVGVFKLNVSKTNKPQWIFFLTGCRSVLDGQTQL